MRAEKRVTTKQRPSTRTHAERLLVQIVRRCLSQPAIRNAGGWSRPRHDAARMLAKTQTFRQLQTFATRRDVRTRCEMITRRVYYEDNRTRQQ